MLGPVHPAGSRNIQGLLGGAGHGPVPPASAGGIPASPDIPLPPTEAPGAPPTLQGSRVGSAGARPRLLGQDARLALFSSDLQSAPSFDPAVVLTCCRVLTPLRKWASSK